MQKYQEHSLTQFEGYYAKFDLDGSVYFFANQQHLFNIKKYKHQSLERRAVVQQWQACLYSCLMTAASYAG